MLLTLSLRDFVIVESLTLDVQAGFTVLTGETGAGKSILIDALQFLLGARADAGQVREGAEKTMVCAEFAPDARARAWLEENDLTAEDGDELIVRRTLDVKGRSRAWVNGVAVTGAQMRDLGERLVDVHGQHAHQSLLRPAYQLRLLDEYAEAGDALADVQEAYGVWQSAVRALEDATHNAQALEERSQRLQWMLEDLGSLAPEAGEWEKLNAEHTRLSHGVAITEGLNGVLEGLRDREESVADRLASMLGRIQSLARYDERLDKVAETLSAGMEVLDDVAHDVVRYLDRCDLDAERFDEVERRVGEYFDMARKFRTEPDDLHALWNRTKAELAALSDTKDVEALKAAERAARAAYDDCDKRLAALRVAAAVRLGKAVTQSMQTLAMLGSCFEAALKKVDPGPRGTTACEFLIAGHAGVQARPLTKVASGGELARVSLAIAVITASLTPVDTLIFDEVDSGIGGATAEEVGRMLRSLGEARQVLCVTHLPQVAACGHQHWRVEKTQRNGRTRSTLKVLGPEGRVDEVARMLAGVSISESTKSVAKEMLAGA